MTDLYKSISKKKLIVDAIVNLMDEEGLKNVTIKDICKEASISVGSFYHYFSSKDSIVQEMYHLMNEYFINNKDRIKMHPTTNEDIVDFVTHFGYYVEEWGYYANLLIIRSSIEDVTKNSTTDSTNKYDLLKEIIQYGVENKGFIVSIDVDDLTSTIFVIIRGYLLEWVKKGKDYPVREKMVRHTRWFLSALKTKSV